MVLKRRNAGTARGFSPEEWLLLIVNVVFASNLVFLIVRQAHPIETGVPTSDGFRAALADVMQPGPEDVVENLWALVPETPGIVWDTTAGFDRVLVATWTGYTGYDGHETESVPLGIDVWVTPVPQLLEQCRAFGLSGESLGRRLRQYLGLAPEGEQDRVVELWVRPLNVFRPCPDAETNDLSCRRGLPEIPDDPTPSDALAHARWFSANFARYYMTSTARPWTRLGYTYDWGNPNTKVGASEYVIRRGSNVWVGSVTGTEQYCTRGGPLPSREPPSIAAQPGN